MSHGMDVASKYWRDKHVEQLEKENAELRDFKESVNKELRLWHLEACDRDQSEKALNNIEDMILRKEQGE